jgi:hypothetical protein
MYEIKFSARKSTCQDDNCRGNIRAFEPRVDYVGSEISESSPVVNRYCLKCGLARMTRTREEVSQRIAQATRVWNNTAKRMKRRKKSEKTSSKNGEVKCKIKKCKAKAVRTLQKKGCGKLFVCEDGHFWID